MYFNQTMASRAISKYCLGSNMGLEWIEITFTDHILPSLISGPLPVVNDSNIVVVTQLKAEISGLKKQVGKKDQELIQKDKQVFNTKIDLRVCYFLAYLCCACKVLFLTSFIYI